MFVYQKFLKYYVGTKRNNWTFVDCKQVKKGKYLRHIVTCKCDCGATAEYNPNHCLGVNFPMACIKCTNIRIKTDSWKQRLLAEEMHQIEIEDPVEDSLIVSACGNYIKRYERD